jgi:hypothetical protein
MCEHAGRDLAKAQPKQLIAQIVALAFQGGRDDGHGPQAVPVLRRRAIDSLRGFGEAGAAVGGETVEAGATAALEAHPRFVRQSSDGCADQSLGQSERHRQFDQTRQGNGAATRRDGIPEDRDEQRPASKRALPPKAGDERVGASDEGRVRFC